MKPVSPVPVGQTNEEDYLQWAKAAGQNLFFLKLLCVLHLCATVWLFILTTVSKGSGLHLLLGLLVTEVTVAMGSWK